MRCPHCFIATQAPDCFESKDIKYDDAIKIINHYCEQGIQQIVPNAIGDVLLYPRYQDVVTYINQKVLRKPWLVTNGVNLREHTDFIVDNLCEVMISLDGTTAKSYANFRGLDERVFQKVIDNIDNLVTVKKSRGVTLPIFINYVVTSDRCHEIPDMIDLATALSVDGIRFTNFHHVDKSSDKEVLSLHRNDQDVVKIIRKVVSRKDYKVSIYLPTLIGLAKPPFYCRMLSTIVIGEQGDYSPCCRINPAGKWGNFFTGSEFHNNETLRSFRKSLLAAKKTDDISDICQTCGYLSQRRPAFNKESCQWVMTDVF